MKRQKNTTQMKEQTRNMEVQIMKRKQASCLKKNSVNDSKDDKKPWKQNGENARIN